LIKNNDIFTEVNAIATLVIVSEYI
jgi:hypothetical protein